MSDAVDFLHADKHESLLKINTKIFWWVWSSIPKVPKKASLQCLYNIPKNVTDKVDIFDADKHRSLLTAWSWKREGHGDGNDQAFSE